MKIGLLTSGGDCQGLNAALRGVAKTLYGKVPELELYGMLGGYRGLFGGDWRKMEPIEFSGIIREGGTILGTSRQPFKKMREADEYGEDRLSMMIRNYHVGGFDALVILGGNGTHKTAHMLSQSGINVVTLPKTIDNDVFGTDLTFGFDSAVDKATGVIDAIHTTAASHGRVFVVELMGNKVGWITLCAGIAGGADVILIPEIDYDVDKVLEVVEARNKSGKNFTIIAIAEGAMSKKEAALPKSERKSIAVSSGNRLAEILSEQLDQDVRTAIPGHYQRGGDPTPTDRLLCTRFGVKAADLICKKEFGYMVGLKGTDIIKVPLEEVVKKTKSIPLDSQYLDQAREMGISLGD